MGKHFMGYSRYPELGSKILNGHTKCGEVLMIWCSEWICPQEVLAGDNCGDAIHMLRDDI